MLGDEIDAIATAGRRSAFRRRPRWLRRQAHHGPCAGLPKYGAGERPYQSHLNQIRILPEFTEIKSEGYQDSEIDDSLNILQKIWRTSKNMSSESMHN